MALSNLALPEPDHLGCENAGARTWGRAGATARLTRMEEGLSALPGGRDALARRWGSSAPSPSEPPPHVVPAANASTDPRAGVLGWEQKSGISTSVFIHRLTPLPSLPKLGLNMGAGKEAHTPTPECRGPVDMHANAPG